MNKFICHLYTAQDEGRHQRGTRGGKQATQLALFWRFGKNIIKLKILKNRDINKPKSTDYNLLQIIDYIPNKKCL